MINSFIHWHQTHFYLGSFGKQSECDFMLHVFLIGDYDLLQMTKINSLLCDFTVTEI